MLNTMLDNADRELVHCDLHGVQVRLDERGPALDLDKRVDVAEIGAQRERIGRCVGVNAHAPLQHDQGIRH